MQRQLSGNRSLAISGPQAFSSRRRPPSTTNPPPANVHVVPGLDEVLRDLALSPTGAAFWFLQASEQLDGHPPIDLLRRRRPDLVRELARQQSLLP